MSDDIRGRQERFLPKARKASDAKGQSLRVRVAYPTLAADHSGRPVSSVDALGEEVRCVSKSL